MDGLCRRRSSFEHGARLPCARPGWDPCRPRFPSPGGRVNLDQMAYLDRRPGPGAVASVAGIAGGLLFFLALIWPWLIVAAMGGAHCTPAPACRTATAVDFLTRALLALGPAILLGAALRRLLHWLGRRLRPRATDKLTGERMATPWGALALVPLAIAGGILLVWYDLIVGYA